MNSPAWMKRLAALTKPFVPWAYRRVDAMVDIGECMRKRLQAYGHGAECATLTPWALAEPPEVPESDPDVRRELFGEAKIGLLYSGTVGYAHDLGPFIGLARECRRRGIDAAFCFAGYGNQYKVQLAQLTKEDTNIRLAGICFRSGTRKTAGRGGHPSDQPAPGMGGHRGSVEVFRRPWPSAARCCFRGRKRAASPAGSPMRNWGVSWTMLRWRRCTSPGSWGTSRKCWNRRGITPGALSREIQPNRRLFPLAPLIGGEMKRND